MTGKFVGSKGMYDLKKSEQRTNAILRREGKENVHTYAVVCQCPDPDCGGWHEIDENRISPTEKECKEILKNHNQSKKDKNI